MYNEVDTLILDSFIECSYCGSKDVSCFSATTTLAACGNNAETSFKHRVACHDHDHNHMDAHYKCNACDKTFGIIRLNACWCGWMQSPKSHSDPAKRHE